MPDSLHEAQGLRRQDGIGDALSSTASLSTIVTLQEGGLPSETCHALPLKGSKTICLASETALIQKAELGPRKPRS